ncbi:AF4/FMR2 family member 1 [Drosophila gunungcola]|uniref:Nucleolar and coiled-body phosphoprotein 1 n=1 Tax=Drosophila gunungcola TaxID=103775 RepID=A0A9Q0BWE6_9MUSC|nr:AF4/FMR2 family member 1 [Drosophila gunungcola]KAI8046656.1 hypothetical protein M5D96_002869 [Drosophila gunungcola]
MLLAAAGLPAYDAGKLASNAGSSSSGVGTPTTASVSRPSAASALMKTLSVRLHRGTEFIKDTVQKALVMSAPTPVAPAPAPAPKVPEHSLKRKLSGTGGLMGSSSSSRGHHYVLASQVPSAPTLPLASQVPTAAFLRTYTVAPTALHRSAAARKRNPSTDSLLMDLCLFKPIRPMPITPIKIHKFRGFEVKKPKFVPAANPDSEEDEDDDEDESVRKPKLSNLTLPTVEGSAFVPMPYIETTNTAITATTTTSSRSRSRSLNTHTSGSAQAITNPKPKRRRRAPMLTAKRRRKAPGTESTSSADGGTEVKPPAKRKTTGSGGVGTKRCRGASITAPTPTDPIKSPAAIKAPAKRKASSRSEVAKRSRGASVVDATPLTATSTSPADLAVAARKSAAKRKAATERGAAKRSRGSAALAARPSPPMTRQRARQQISASN